MITIDIKFMLYLVSSTDLRMGKKGVSVEIKEGSTFNELLQGLEQSFGSALAEEILDPQTQSMHELVMAAINGVLVHNLPDGTDTVLQQGDAVVFFPVAMGG